MTATIGKPSLNSTQTTAACTTNIGYAHPKPKPPKPPKTWKAPATGKTMDTLSTDIQWYKDWQFWLLLIAINISGNPGFNVLFPYHATIIALFIGLLAYLLIKQKRLPKKEFLYILLWTFLFIINGVYVKEFAINSTLHIIMKMTISSHIYASIFS